MMPARCWSSFVCSVMVILAPLCAAAEPALDFAVPAGVNAAIIDDGRDGTSQAGSTAAGFDVDPDGLPAVADGATIRLFGSKQELMTIDTDRIDDFAFMRDGKLLLVTKGRLASMSRDGLVLGPLLPATGMRVRPAGADTAYVFGSANPAIDHDVYLFARDGKIVKLVSLPVPVAAVAGDGHTSYVAAGNTVLRIAFDEPVRAVLEARDPVISLETAPNDAVFYTTKSAVGYVDRGGRAVEFIRGRGGLLRARGSTLFVLLSDGALLRFSPTEKFEVALEPLENDIAARPAEEPVVNPVVLAEIEDRLYELNFDPPRRDGGLDGATAAVIREYQQASGRSPTGKPTYGLLRSLRAAGGRSPWGAIVFAREAGTWGMAWGQASRKAAVANAVSSCGDPAHCSSELSFFGSDCGAFAYAGKDWAITARGSSSEARDAAVGDCQRRGAKCSLVAAVCADGSNHWPTER